MTDDLPDGIFFNLPMEQYVALPRLGAHGIGNLRVSPATFWERSWLNPTPRKVSDSVVKTRLIGSAYHCARLELEHFEDRYVREPSKAEMPEGSLFTGADMGAELERRTLKKTGSVADQAARLIEDGFPAEQLWQSILVKWSEQVGARIPIDPETWQDIITDGERLRQSPEVAALLDGGIAEVTILWTDEKGVKCKCRPDKLNADRWLDLKTFTNTNGKELERALADAIQYNRYHLSVTHYRDAIEMVRGANLEIVGDATDLERELIEAIQLQRDELACWLIFQEKGGVPNILGKRMRFFEVPLSTTVNSAITDDPERLRKMERATEEPSLWFSRARGEIRSAKRTFALYSTIYEPGQPWLPFKPLSELTDQAFHANWLSEEFE